MTVCDPVTLAAPPNIPGNGPDVNMLDCAIVELSSTPLGIHVREVAPSLSIGQNVLLHGAVTGTTRHKLGALCLSYAFKQGGDVFCFKDSIELLPRPRGPVGGQIGCLFSKAPTQGDSGGWVITEDSPPDWAGIFFGEDGSRGFAIRASWAKQWAENALGSHLTV